MSTIGYSDLITNAHTYSAKTHDDKKHKVLGEPIGLPITSAPCHMGPGYIIQIYTNPNISPLIVDTLYTSNI